ncbi:MAG: ABC transporter substrate-binding protein [Anaeromicrobium sp.]|uniref:ABC transporter substrate-binding protein n=1 Tax=Anaeromicrobium sp. TaxID=1929132 RepID=UPI0025CF0176|nr:ABC transporter substrate-binding protein [Anaeromicrobium sp.]MCT4593991.1 ABC transporter substrate-binding protein [Anaeromicrobium sp.]
MKKISRIMALLIVLSLFITACSSKNGVDTSANVESTGEKVKKDTFTVVFKGEPGNLDPQNNSQLVAYATERVLYDTLIQKDEEGNLIPGIAKKWEVIDDTTVRFYLRDDVYFHNGDQLTGEDVKYTINRATKMPLTATIFSSFDGENTSVVDKFTVDVKLKTPFAAVYNYLTYSRAAIVSKKAMEEMGEVEYGRNPVGTGPLKLKEWVNGTSITLERNDNYWGEKPQYKDLVIKFISEPANRAIELETGGADAVFDIDENDIRRLEEAPELQVLKGPSYKITYLVLNLQDERFKDPKVREAFSYAIDKESLVDAVFSGTAKVADSVMPTTIFGYKSIGKTPYDPEKAKKLLAEAGFAGGMNIKLKTNQDKKHRNVTEIIQNMWKNVGVNVEIKIMDKATYLASKEVFEVVIASQTATTGDPGHVLWMWDSSYTKGSFHSTDPKIDELLDKGMKTYEPEARKKVYEELQDYLWDGKYMIPIAFPSVVYGTGTHVENFEVSPSNTPNLAKVVVYEK